MTGHVLQQISKDVAAQSRVQITAQSLSVVRTGGVQQFQRLMCHQRQQRFRQAQPSDFHGTPPCLLQTLGGSTGRNRRRFWIFENLAGSVLTPSGCSLDPSRAGPCRHGSVYVRVAIKKVYPLEVGKFRFWSLQNLVGAVLTSSVCALDPSRAGGC